MDRESAVLRPRSSAPAATGTTSGRRAGCPTGLAINAGTGVINGTPTTAGAPTATITLNDVSGDTPATRQYVVTINAAPSITTASPLPAGELTLVYNTTLAGTGGTTAYTLVGDRHARGLVAQPRAPE